MNYSATIIALLLLSAFCFFSCDQNTAPEESSITMISPNGGEVWEIGTTQTIKWKSSNVSGDVKIEISTNGGTSFTTLFSGTPNDGQLPWNITGQISSNVVLRISSLNDPSVSDKSDAPFTLTEVLTAPTNLVAALAGARNISLTWQDNSSNEQGFIIERRIGVTGNWLERARVNSGIITFGDSSLLSNRAYSYRVRAYSNEGVSGETNVVTENLGWVLQTSNTTQPLFGVSYANSLTGTAVGQNGTILRTTDGGDSWNGVASGTTNSFNAVSFYGPLNGVIVGAQGSLLRTTDGGATWSAQTVGGTGYYLRGVDFASANTVFVVGYRYDSQITDSTWGAVFKSTNGGAGWSLANEQWRYAFEDVSFSSVNTGFTVGNIGGSHDAMFKTQNGGTLWSLITTGAYFPLYGVHFLDANTGMAVGRQGTIVRTINGGANWVDQSYGTVKTFHKIVLTDVLHALVVGDNGLVVRTTDGGTNWISQTTGSTENYFGLFANDGNTQTIVGSNGVIYKTNNGGM